MRLREQEIVIVIEHTHQTDVKGSEEADLVRESRIVAKQ